MPKRKHKHTQEAIKQRGEVFTPTKLVNEMLGKLPPSVFRDKDKTFLDNSCGNGQFLFAVMERKMWWMMKNSKMRLHDAHKQALSTIYGVEIDPQNAEDCRRRLLNGVHDEELRAIVDHNIIYADGLDQHHMGWKGVGFYWDETLQPDPEIILQREEKKRREEEKQKKKTEQTKLPIKVPA